MKKVYETPYTKGWTQHIGKKLYFDIDWDVANWQFGIGLNTELAHIDIHLFRYTFCFGIKI